MTDDELQVQRDWNALVVLLARDHACDSYITSAGCRTCRRRANLIIAAGFRRP